MLMHFHSGGNDQHAAVVCIADSWNPSFGSSGGQLLARVQYQTSGGQLLARVQHQTTGGQLLARMQHQTSGGQLLARVQYQTSGGQLGGLERRAPN